MSIETEQLLDRYLTGRLPERERVRFEEHYFGCDECFHELQAVRLIIDALRYNP